MVPSVAAGAMALTACMTDIRSRRIPNVLTLGGAATAFVFHLVTGGLTALGWSSAAWAIGLLLFLPFFALRGIGGGDVKLLAALGAWIGPALTVWLAFWSAIAGGVFALAVALGRGYTGTAFKNVWGMLTYWKVMGLRPHPVITLDSKSGPRLPYSLPIAAGLGLTLWLA